MNQTKRIIDINEYLPVLRELTDQGKEVSFLLTGNSMAPFLVNERDYIYFKKPDRPLKKGDMVFYQRKNGQYVMHRIYRATAQDFDLIGDAHTEIEHGIRQEQIFGLITKVKRKGKILTDGSFCWEFFKHIWLNVIPLRPLLLRSYNFLKRISAQKQISA